MSDPHIDPEVFDPEIYRMAKEDGCREQGNEPLFTTSVLPDLGIDADNIPVPSYEDIRRNKAAYLLFLHKVKEQGIVYQNAMRAVAQYKRKSKDRLLSVVLLTISEIITSIGISGLFTSEPLIFAYMLAAGIILTSLSLYLNFRK